MKGIADYLTLLFGKQFKMAEKEKPGLSGNAPKWYNVLVEKNPTLFIVAIIFIILTISFTIIVTSNNNLTENHISDIIKFFSGAVMAIIGVFAGSKIK